MSFEQYKKDMLKLIDHALERELHLNKYVKDSTQDVEVMNKEHKCGSPACLAGYLPEVFPDRFEWYKSSSIGIKVRVIGKDCGTISDLNHHLGGCSGPFFFSINGTNVSDIKVVKQRRKVLEASHSFEELNDLIDIINGN